MAELNVVWKPLPGSQTLALTCPAQIILYHGTRGPGKGQPYDEKILTKNGYKEIGLVQPYDEVFDPVTGGLVSVAATYPQGLQPCVALHFSNGAVVRCDLNHLWLYRLYKGHSYIKKKANTNSLIKDFKEDYVFVPVYYNYEIKWVQLTYIEVIKQQHTVCIKLLNEEGLYCTSGGVITHNTDVQLMRFRSRVGIGFGKYWRGIIFDQEYKNLDDLISKSDRWFTQFDDGARFNGSTQSLKWIWPTGEELLFRVVKKEDDYWKYHGQEFPYIGWNELTKYADPQLFDMMLSCNRSSYMPRNKEDYQGPIPLEVFATTNPHGVGHHWVKKRFIDAGAPGELIRSTTRIFNPRSQQEEDVVTTKTHIFGSYKENIYLDPKYIANLVNTKDPNQKKAWAEGSWDVVAGGMFGAQWDSRYHVVFPFKIPPTWKIDRSFDWGSSAPFSVGWWAESDGSDIELADGRTRSTVRGDLFRVAEWYGADENHHGLQMLAIHVARGIKEREARFYWGSRVTPGPADNSIWNVENGNSIAASMSAQLMVDGKQVQGVYWNRSDKSPGSRVAGWEQIRVRLLNAIPVEGARDQPGIFIFATCTSFIEIFPHLPRDPTNPDDVDTKANDHIADETRYRVLASKLGVKSGNVKGLI